VCLLAVAKITGQCWQWVSIGPNWSSSLGKGACNSTVLENMGLRSGAVDSDFIITF
jgi:hypothetical protein